MEFSFCWEKKSHSVVAKGNQSMLQANVTELILFNRAGADPQDVLASRAFLSKPGEKSGSSACMAVCNPPVHENTWLIYF